MKTNDLMNNIISIIQYRVSTLFQSEILKYKLLQLTQQGWESLQRQHCQQDSWLSAVRTDVLSGAVDSTGRLEPPVELSEPRKNVA